MSARRSKPHRDPLVERGHDLYQTPEEAGWALVEHEGALLPGLLVEPAVGRGRLARVLVASGRDVVSSDVELWRGRPDGTLELDFLTGRFPRAFSGRGFVTNPPFHCAARFVRRAVETGAYCAFLLRFMFVEGGVGNTGASADRRFVLDRHPPARILVFKKRLPRMHRDGWQGAQAESDTAYAWFIWDGPTGAGETRIKRIDWRSLPPNRSTRPPRGGG